MYTVPRVPQCLSPRPNWDPRHPPPASECVSAPPEPKGGGTHSHVGEEVGGGGGVPIRTKPSTLSTLGGCQWIGCSGLLQLEKGALCGSVHLPPIQCAFCAFLQFETFVWICINIRDWRQAFKLKRIISRSIQCYSWNYKFQQVQSAVQKTVYYCIVTLSFLCMVLKFSCYSIINHWGRILGRNPDKVVRVFLLAIHSHLCSFAWRFQLFQIHATSYSFCKGERRKTW